MKSIKNIADKNKELLNAFSVANKVGKAAKNESDYNYDTRFAFYRSYGDFERFIKRSIVFKYSDMTEFRMLLDAFKIPKTASTESKERKKEL